MRKHKVLLSVAAVVVAIGITIALLLFEPWRAFTSSELDEASPLVAGTSAQQPPTGPKVLAEGTFAGQEHETSGAAQVIERSDGTRVLRIEGLASSDGPDLHVWLSEAKARLADWGAYDDGRFVPLGELKATHGNHNYEIPADAPLDGLQSVVIWCDRFNVAFGSAPLRL